MTRAQIDKREQVEPLPDLDFNIRSGNVLVGYHDASDAEAATVTTLEASLQRQEVIARLDAVVGLREEWTALQEKATTEEQVRGTKAALRDAIESLEEELDRLYANATAAGKATDFASWRESHRPFHWFVEFPSVIRAGGFDVVLGNPPFISKKKVEKESGYTFSGFESEECYDIFASCMERAADITHASGRFAMVAPIALQFSTRYQPARDALEKRLPTLWVSTYSRNPAALFPPGLGVRPIIVMGHAAEAQRLYTTATRRWIDEYRPHLFETIRYVEVSPTLERGSWVRLANEGVRRVLEVMFDSGSGMASSTRRSSEWELGYKTTALYYISIYTEEPPVYDAPGKRGQQTKTGSLAFSSEQERDAALALLCGKLGVLWWAADGDDFDVTREVLESFPLAPGDLSAFARTEILRLSGLIQDEMTRNPIFTRYAGKLMGNWDMKRVRHLTDEVDRIVLRDLGLGEEGWEALELFYAGFAKATGERPGTVRELPAEYARHA